MRGGPESRREKLEGETRKQKLESGKWEAETGKQK